MDLQALPVFNNNLAILRFSNHLLKLYHQTVSCVFSKSSLCDSVEIQTRASVDAYFCSKCVCVVPFANQHV